MVSVDLASLRNTLMTAYVRGWYDGMDGVINDDGKREVSKELLQKLGVIEER